MENRYIQEAKYECQCELFLCNSVQVRNWNMFKCTQGKVNNSPLATVDPGFVKIII